MAIRLEKGQTINLEKKVNDLSKVTIGLGWKIREKKKGLLASLFGGGDDEEYDLDAIAFMLGADGKVASLGNRLVGGDVVFFNSKRHPSGTVWSCGDNLVGGDGNSDDEQIVCLLDNVPWQYQRIVFVVSIYKGMEKGQCFGEVEGAYIRAVDAKGREMARYSLSGETAAANAQSVIFAELYRHGDNWKFRALGEPRSCASFVDVLKEYL